MIGWMGPGIRQVVGFGIGPRKGVIWGRMGSLRHRCAKVCEPSHLWFKVVCAVGQGIGGDAACFQIILGNLVLNC